MFETVPCFRGLSSGTSRSAAGSDLVVVCGNKQSSVAMAVLPTRALLRDLAAVPFPSTSAARASVCALNCASAASAFTKGQTLQQQEQKCIVKSCRGSKPVLNISWSNNAAVALCLFSPVSSNSRTSVLERMTRSATAEDVEAEKELIEEDAMERMDKSLETVKLNFNTIRTGRASPTLLDRVEVEYYGTQVILKSIAQVSTPDGSTIMVTPFDKSSLQAIEKAISKSDVGLTPSNDGNVIRLNVPQLTTERRKELLKLVSKLTEDGKVAIRNVRRDALKSFDKLEKEKKLSEDNVKDAADEIQKLTDDYVKKIDSLFKQKEKELTTV